MLYVTVGIVTTTFAVFGIYLLKALKSLTRKMNFLIRFLIYIFVYAFGIGLLSVLIVKLIAALLGNLNNLHLVLAVGLVFLLLGIAAKIQKQV
jgi:uncharacterized membrane protein (DUF373 family)